MDLVKNNLQEQLSLFKNTTNQTQRLSAPNESTSSRKKFSFKRLSYQDTNKKQEFLSTSSVVTTKPTATVAPVTNVSPPRVIPVPVTNVPPPPRVIPVPVTPRSFDTVSPSLKDYNVPTLPIKVTTPAISNQQFNDSSETLLIEIQAKRLKVMDDICEIINEIPSNTISTLFGATAGYIQKKLAMRRKLLSQEANITKNIQHTSPPSLPQRSCDSHVITDNQLVEEWEEIIDNDEDVYIPGTRLAINQSSFNNTGTPVNNTGTPVSNTRTPVNNTSTPFSNTGTSFSTPFSNTGTSVNNTGTPFSSTGPPASNSVLSHSRSFNTTSVSIRPPSNSRPQSNTRPPASSSKPYESKGDNSSEFASSNYPHSTNLVNIFKNVFGLRQFRPKQQEAINAAVIGKDCFILMPTGGGKSLCYQLPSLVVSGITIVISPLRSLIHDQVQKLCSLEIPACHLSGEMNQGDELRVYTELSLREPRLKLLYVTPEKLVASQKLVSALQALYTRQKLTRFVVDEAHCISSWGHDFRPDYKRLCQLRTKFPTVPLMALTATATPRVQADILHQLNMKHTKWFTQSFNRTNLLYSVVQKKPKKVTHDIIELIHSKFRNQSGIIYCLSRRDCEVVSNELNGSGIPSVAYHAGLQDEERSCVQNRWLRDSNCKVVCATIAFGMGIDKPDVRFVIHHTIPKSIEGYYQESGRAGRDGRPAHCVLYYNYGDMSRIRRLLMMEDNKANLGQNMANLFRIVQYCENESDCRRLQLLEYFAEQFDDKLCKTSSTPCDNCQSATPLSTQDVTDLVKVIVHSVNIIPSKDQYTLVQHIDALRGTNSTRPSLSSLPYAKKGMVLSKHDLERLLHMMVLNNILGEDLLVGSHGNVISYVKLGHSANSILNGSYGTILLKVKNKTANSGTGGNIIGPGGNEIDKLKEECYQELKRLRTSIAVDSGKNPEVVISITTLQDMAQKLPMTKEDMLNIQGMTVAKWNSSNGEDFLRVTCEYGNNIQQSGAGNDKENDGGSTVARRRKRSKGTTKKDCIATPTRIITTSYDSEDEFDNIAQTTKKRTVSRQTRLPGYLTLKNM